MIGLLGTWDLLRGSSDAEEPLREHVVAPGKRTLTAALPPVQMRSSRGFAAQPVGGPEIRPAAPVDVDDPFSLHFPQAVQAKGALAGAEVQAQAACGVAGASSPLPHLAAIQQSFGKHDVTHVRAQVGGAAAAAADTIGAEAFATGDRVAFGQAPDLHLAAHEAAHVVQQRAGVSLKDGRGQAGDRYEQHADAVADAVVRGESAEALLDSMSGSAGDGAAAVQLRSKPPAKPATIWVELGGQRYEILDGTMRLGDVEVGTVEEDDVRNLKKRGPQRLRFTPGDTAGGLAAGDLLAGAADGTRITVGTAVWVKAEGDWQQATGKKGQGKGVFGGFVKTGGGSVESKLNAMVAAGQLHLTPEQVAVIAGVAKVETDGALGGAQSYDDQVMSVGFKQVTLGHGSLERLINAAPAGFAKHGIVLDPSAKYPKQKAWSVSPSKIVGVGDAEDLRSPEWVTRFYAASMEPDVVAILCQLVLADMTEVRGDMAAAGGQLAQRLDDLTAQAWLMEVANNRPAFLDDTIAKVNSSTSGTREEFLDALAKAIIDTYVEQEPLIHYKRAKRKRKLSPSEDAKLLKAMQDQYAPIGQRKGTNIVTKIPRIGPASATSARAPSAPPQTTQSLAVASPDAKRAPGAASLSAAPTASAQSALGAGAGAHAPPKPTATPQAQDDVDEDDPWAVHLTPKSEHGDSTSTSPSDLLAAPKAVLGVLGDAGAIIAGERSNGGGTKAPPPAAPSSSPSQAPQPPARVPAGDPHAFEGSDLGALAAKVKAPAVQQILVDLAGLATLSAKLSDPRNANRNEEQGAGRDQLVAGIGAVRRSLEGLKAVGTNGPDVDAFKAAAYRKLQEVSPFYFQSRNVDILEPPQADKTRTCNMTVLGMALESLGKDASMYGGRWDAVLAAAKAYEHKIVGDAVSKPAEDATGGRGADRGNLTGLRLPDFLELVAIALEIKGDPADVETVRAAQKHAYKTIKDWGNIAAMARTFGVSADIRRLDVTGAPKHRDANALRAHGMKHRKPIEAYLNSKAGARGRLRAAYEDAVNNTDLDSQVGIDAYRDYILDEVGPEIESGASVIVGLARHFVKLQSVDHDHVVVHDPARAERRATPLSYQEARAMGYFHMRIVLK